MEEKPRVAGGPRLLLGTGSQQSWELSFDRRERPLLPQPALLPGDRLCCMSRWVQQLLAGLWPFGQDWGQVVSWSLHRCGQVGKAEAPQIQSLTRRLRGQSSQRERCHSRYAAVTRLAPPQGQPAAGRWLLSGLRVHLGLAPRGVHVACEVTLRRCQPDLALRARPRARSGEEGWGSGGGAVLAMPGTDRGL